MTWADWLKQQSQGGDQAALEALRARTKKKPSRGNAVSGPHDASDPRGGIQGPVDGITKDGTIIYRKGLSAVRDDGDRLHVSNEATNSAIKEAVKLAVERFGTRITVSGTAEFKAQIIKAAVELNAGITFVDAALEREKLKLQTQKEKEDGRARSDDRRTDGSIRQRTASNDNREPGRGAGGINATGAVSGKPNIARAAGKPPSANKNRLRNLSELGVVLHAGRSEMLLPGNVSGDLEHKGTRPADQLRRDVSGPGITATSTTAKGGKTPVARIGQKPPPTNKNRMRRLSQLGVLPKVGALQPSAPANPAPVQRPATTNQPGGTTSEQAAKKYVAEREEKRTRIFDIPKHSLYTGGQFAGTFAGLRDVDGQKLALIKSEKGITVLPIDHATNEKLKRMTIGQSVTVTSKGTISRSKGRSR